MNPLVASHLESLVQYVPCKPVEQLQRARHRGLVFIDSPGNPTSTHVAAGALREFLTHLSPHVIAVIGEAHRQYATADDYATALTMRTQRERLIVLRTFSKT